MTSSNILRHTSLQVRVGGSHLVPETSASHVEWIQTRAEMSAAHASEATRSDDVIQPNE